MPDINIVIGSAGRGIIEPDPSMEKANVRIWEPLEVPVELPLILGEIFNDSDTDKTVDFQVVVHKFGHKDLLFALLDEADKDLVSPLSIPKNSSIAFKLAYNAIGNFLTGGSPLINVVVNIKENTETDWEDGCRALYTKKLTSVSDLYKEFGEIIYDPGIWYDMEAVDMDLKMTEMIKEEEESFWLSIDKCKSLAPDFSSLIRRFVVLKVGRRIFTKQVINALGGENWYLKLISNLRDDLIDTENKLNNRLLSLGIVKHDS